MSSSLTGLLIALVPMVAALTGGMLVGSPLILLGCLLATRRSRPRDAPASVEHPVSEPARS